MKFLATPLVTSSVISCCSRRSKAVHLAIGNNSGKPPPIRTKFRRRTAVMVDNVAEHLSGISFWGEQCSPKCWQSKRQKTENLSPIETTKISFNINTAVPTITQFHMG